MRKELRQRGQRANELVRDVEDTMKAWLDGTTTAAAEQVLRPVTPLQLKWKTDDPFAWYIVQGVARGFIQ